MTNSELQSKTIDWLRFPLAGMVVFIHMNPVVNIQQIDFHSLSFADNFFHIAGTLFSKTLPAIAVPSFFMFSGFLFFYKLSKWNETVYFRKLKGRFKTLIIPYLLWNLVLIFIFVAIKIAKMDGSIYPFLNELYDNGLLKIFWNYKEWGTGQTNIFGWVLSCNYGSYLLPLWFLRDLILCVSLTPLVYYFVKYTKIYSVIFLGILYYVKLPDLSIGYNINQLIIALFFFSFGAYFSIFGKNLVSSLRKKQIIWLSLAGVFLILSTCLCNTFYISYFFPLYVFTGVISAVIITSFFIEKEKWKVVKTLSNASFFVYCLHSVFVLGVSGTILRKTFTLLFHNELEIISYFLTPFLCVVICVSIYLLMRRFTPKILGLLTGNR
jgi:surface polysaccharide O-acyltransferase-like enzyme